MTFVTPLCTIDILQKKKKVFKNNQYSWENTRLNCIRRGLGTKLQLAKLAITVIPNSINRQNKCFYFDEVKNPHHFDEIVTSKRKLISFSIRLVGVSGQMEEKVAFYALPFYRLLQLPFFRVLDNRMFFFSLKNK